MQTDHEEKEDRLKKEMDAKVAELEGRLEVLRKEHLEYRSDIESKLTAALLELNKKKDVSRELAAQNIALEKRVDQLQFDNMTVSADRDRLARELESLRDTSSQELDRLRLHYEQQLYILKNETGKD